MKYHVTLSIYRGGSIDCWCSTKADALRVSNLINTLTGQKTVIHI